MLDVRRRLRRAESTQRRPAGAPDETGRRVAHLPAAIVGNGSLLATVSRRGEIEKLFWPHVDWAQQLAELRVGCRAGRRLRWLDGGGFSYRQRYVDDSTVLVTDVAGGAVEAEIVDVVDPEHAILCRRIRFDGTEQAVAYVRPTLGGSGGHGGCYVDPETGALVFYCREHVLAVALGPGGEARVGRSHDGAPSHAFGDLGDGRLEPVNVEYGSVDGSLVAPAHGEVTLVLALGATPQAALRLLAGADFESVYERRLAHDRDALAESAEPLPEDEPTRSLYRRSLLTFDLLADRDTGGVIAAPEMDELFLHSGGYGFVWGRDVAYTVLAFLAGGKEELARAALRWLVHAQSPEGLWLHRHWTNGTLAPSWGLHQIDETGSVLAAFEAAWRALGDEALDAELWPAARRAADFLLAFRDPATGLPLPSVDLWEERQGVHAYSSAAVAAGLRAAEALAVRHDPDLAGRYAEAAALVAAAVEREFWDEERGRYVRSLDVDRSDGRLVRGRQPVASHPNRNGSGVEPVDAALDVSLLGLSWPFAIVDARSDRMTSTVASLERGLGLPGGGVLRYEGDVYAGGNSWVLAVLWLGLWHRLAGNDDRYRECLDYAVRARTAVGLLPEQVAADGSPAWVVPLTWSHAMLVLATRPELAVPRGAARNERAGARA